MSPTHKKQRKPAADQGPAGEHNRSTPSAIPAFADEPPQDASLTEYDRRHLALYIRLLDAADEGAPWTEVTRILFGLDPKPNRERARRVYESHLARARWMTEHGHRDLLRSAMH